MGNSVPDNSNCRHVGINDLGPDALPTSIQRRYLTLLARLQNLAAGDTLGYQLALIYEFLDLINAHRGVRSTAQRHCGRCCCGDVLMTRLEAEYLAVFANIPLDQNDLDGVSSSAGHRTPCPFVGERDRCTVFAHRPFACRIGATTTPTNCEPDSVQQRALDGAASEHQCVETLRRWLQTTQYNEAGLHFPRDIRDWFPRVGAKEARRSP
jgi:uncharacterized protein